MSKFTSKFKYMWDAAAAANLIPKDHVVKTASFNSASYVFPTVDGWWNNPTYPADFVFAVAINVEAFDATTGDETYTLELEWGTAAADYTNSIKTHKAIVKATGQLAFLVDMDTVRALKPDAGTCRIAATLAGTTPSIALHAWLAGAIKDAD